MISKNIIFIGTNTFASKILNKLIEKKIKIRTVITKCDKKFGRGQKLKFYPVNVISQKYGIKLYTVSSINSDNIKKVITSINPDIIIVVEYGEKINDELIKIPMHGIINLHPSVLPRFKGSQPIQYAIIKGESITGVSIININNVMDSGDILNVKKCKIEKKDTYQSLSKKLLNIGYKCLIETLKDIEHLNVNAKKQGNKKYAYAKKNNNKNNYIDWNTSASYINSNIRAYLGIKKFNTRNNNINFKVIETVVLKKETVSKVGEIIKLNKYGIDVITSNNILRIKKIQFPGKNVNTILNLLNSNKIYFKIGDILT